MLGKENSEQLSLDGFPCSHHQHGLLGLPQGEELPSTKAEECLVLRFHTWAYALEKNRNGYAQKDRYKNVHCSSVFNSKTL